MKLSKNFTLAEFTKSQTAIRRGIDNTPTPEHLINAGMLFANIVQKVRNRFGPTVINSGYRGKALNEAVGGSARSQHCKGMAVDIEVPGVDNLELATWIYENCEYDQLILEFYEDGIPDSGWIHVSYNSEDTQRKSTLHAYKQNGKTVYSNWTP